MSVSCVLGSGTNVPQSEQPHTRPCLTKLAHERRSTSVDTGYFAGCASFACSEARKQHARHNIVFSYTRVAAFSGRVASLNALQTSY